jgi:8-oxo-dGTP pyrophosphatase MutT (NUDIX family)
MGVNLIAGIGGKIGDSENIKGESHAEGLIREFREEINVTPLQYTKLGRVRFIWPDKLKWSQDVRIYTIQKWEGEPTETEAIKPTWFSINDLPLNQMWEDNAYWVPPSLKGEKVDMVFLIGNDNKIIDKITY